MSDQTNERPSNRPVVAPADPITGPDATEPEPQETEGTQGLPLPDVPLPLGMFFGLVPIQDPNEHKDVVVFVTASTPAGSMLQGYLSVDQALKIGISLAQLANQAIAARPPKLIVPEGLVVPGR